MSFYRLPAMLASRRSPFFEFYNNCIDDFVVVHRVAQLDVYDDEVEFLSAFEFEMTLCQVVQI